MHLWTDSSCLFVCIDALKPSQQYFSHVWTIAFLPGFNQDYKAEDKESCSQTQGRSSGEPWTSNPNTLPLILCLFVWFDSLRPVNNFAVMSGWVFLGWTSTKQWLMWLAQGHNSLMLVWLEPATPWSRVKHSTTEPLRSLKVYHWISATVLHKYGLNIIKLITELSTYKSGFRHRLYVLMKFIKKVP